MARKSATKTTDDQFVPLRAAVKDAEKHWKAQRQKARDAKGLARTAKKALKAARKRLEKAEATAVSQPPVSAKAVKRAKSKRPAAAAPKKVATAESPKPARKVRLAKARKQVVAATVDAPAPDQTITGTAGESEEEM
ncbi:MAG: hypothetical protein ACJ8OJ_22710 [Povalibacter sp.]|jgi:hypothetical protein